MKKYKKMKYIMLLFIFILQIFAMQVNGVTAEASNNIILLIDDSGSMKQTDPNKLSIAAAAMLIDTVEQNTNINVIAFGDKIISPHQLINKPSHQALKSLLLSLKFDNKYTDLKEGINEALNQLQRVQGSKSIIVLSDGKEDPMGGLDKEHNEQLNALIEKAYSNKVKIHCIGLSKYADEAALKNIAFKTQGDYFYCENPSELFHIFNNILGNTNSFYTIDEYTTDTKGEKNIKLSENIEEVIIKIVSIDSKSPLVEVTQDGKKIATALGGDIYKIYNVKNMKNSEIKIRAVDKKKNLVIVQVKSRQQLKINSSENSFVVPKAVPIELEVHFEADKNIMGIHMDKIDGGIRENVSKTGATYKFPFKKDKKGEYPVLITAYDGSGYIIAVTSINVSVTDDPPFYFTSPLPEQIITEKQFVVQLMQLDKTMVNNPTGEIIVDYGSSQERFPLSFEAGMLKTEVTLHKSGDVKITTNINGIKDNESFSYFLPSFKAKVVEKPYLELEAEQKKVIKKVDEILYLNLNIKNSLVYENEKIFVMDSQGDKVGEFIITPTTKGIVEVRIKSEVKGKKLAFTLKSENSIKVTDKINTNISVLSNFQYYLRWVKVPIIGIVIFTMLGGLIIMLGKLQYERFVAPYKVNKEIYYEISPDYTNKIVNLELSVTRKEKYLNLSYNIINCDEFEDNAIGKFLLYTPNESSVLQGLKYLIKKEQLFYLEYIPILEQDIMKGDELISGITAYARDMKLVLRLQRKVIKIYFT